MKEFEDMVNIVFVMSFHFAWQLQQMGLSMAYEKVFKEIVGKLERSRRKSMLKDRGLVELMQEET